MVVIDQPTGRPVLASDGGHTTKFTEIIEWGVRLAETPVGITESDKNGLWNAVGWKEFVAHMPAHKQPLAAIMLENCRRKFGRLDEVTRTSNLGTFDKWIFPVIANMSENDVIDQLVALQPMAGPVSQIVYMDIVTGKRKGRTPAGAPMWRALQGAVDRDDDGDEIIQDESTTTTPSGGTLASITLEWIPVRPGTVQLTIGSTTTVDDGNGSFIATTGSDKILAGSINYVTGVISSVTNDSSLNGAAVSITYQYNSEGNINNQEYEIKLSSTPVTAKVMKLKAVWSEEADQNLQAMYNIRAESVLLNALTNALQYQKHRQVIFDLRARADAGFVVWDAIAPSSVNYQTHKFSFVDAIETGSNFIFGATNMAVGNWVLTGLQGATVVATLPHFVARNNRTQMQGITYIGDLGNKRVFADPHYPTNEFLIGHKGDQFLTTGYVLAEYQKLYTTPDIMLPDFLHQRGFATSFAKKVVNSKMFARGLIRNSPTSFGTVIG
jgi:hypothetical protein